MIEGCSLRGAVNGIFSIFSLFKAEFELVLLEFQLVNRIKFCRIRFFAAMG